MSKIGLYPAITEVFLAALRRQRRSARHAQFRIIHGFRGTVRRYTGNFRRDRRRPRRSCAMITMMIGSVSSSGMGALLLLLRCLSLREPINPLHEIQISVDGRVPPDR